MKPYFPLFIPLEGRSVLIVGGGAVALRKAEKLTPYAPALRVIAPVILPALEELAACDRRAPGTAPQSPGCTRGRPSRR